MQSWIIWFVVFFAVILPLITRRKRVAAIGYLQVKKKHQKESGAMKELAKQFIGKECIIYTLTGGDTAVKGTVREVTDGGLIIERADGIEAVNLEYIARIREWPRNAKGKKKQIFE